MLRQYLYSEISSTRLLGEDSLYLVSDTVFRSWYLTCAEYVKLTTLEEPSPWWLPFLPALIASPRVTETVASLPRGRRKPLVSHSWPCPLNVLMWQTFNPTATGKKQMSYTEVQEWVWVFCSPICDCHYTHGQIKWHPLCPVTGLHGYPSIQAAWKCFSLVSGSLKAPMSYRTSVK